MDSDTFSALLATNFMQFSLLLFRCLSTVLSHNQLIGSFIIYSLAFLIESSNRIFHIYFPVC